MEVGYNIGHLWQQSVETNLVSFLGVHFLCLEMEQVILSVEILDCIQPSEV